MVVASRLGFTTSPDVPLTATASSWCYWTHCLLVGLVSQDDLKIAVLTPHGKQFQCLIAARVWMFDSFANHLEENTSVLNCYDKI